MQTKRIKIPIKKLKISQSQNEIGLDFRASKLFDVLKLLITISLSTIGFVLANTAFSKNKINPALEKFLYGLGIDCLFAVLFCIGGFKCYGLFVALHNKHNHDNNFRAISSESLFGAVVFSTLTAGFFLTRGFFGFIDMLGEAMKH